MANFRDEAEKILYRYVPVNCVSDKEDYNNLIKLISIKLTSLYEDMSKNN